MKTIVTLFSKSFLLLFCMIALLTSCKKEKEPATPDENLGAIKGQPGNPRFNLQFTNSVKVDLDLYVQTPDGSIISYSNQTAQNGELDVDCLCSICPNGPNENIFWTAGTAPSGTYKVWVEYFGDCDGSEAASKFTLRIMENSTILNTYTGTLTPVNDKSTVYNFTF
jgi:uncharacterized protein YfaP (DUF2135 family)